MDMPDEKLLILGLADRPWGEGKMYQRFLGRYVLDEDCGLYFEDGTSAEQRKRIGRAFLAQPRQLRQPAYEHKLTLSTTPYAYTAAGNSSTFYGDFRPGRKLSPHIELSAKSLDGLLEPHLTHELAHLFWGLLPQEKRDAYERFLVESCGKASVEVTEYVNERFKEWRRSLDIPDTESWAQNHRACYLKSWVAESFCDSVAASLNEGYAWTDCNVDWGVRRKAIESLTGLKLTKRCRGGVAETKSQKCKAKVSGRARILKLRSRSTASGT